MPFMVQHLVKLASHSQCHVITFTPASEPLLSCSLHLDTQAAPFHVNPVHQLWLGSAFNSVTITLFVSLSLQY